MQQSYGNRAVQRWLATQRSIQPAVDGAKAGDFIGEQDIGENSLSKADSGSSLDGGVSISNRTDSFEHASEQTAARVVAGGIEGASTVVAQRTPAPLSSTLVQRRRSVEEQGEEPIQRRVPASTAPATSNVSPQQLARFRELVAQAQILLQSNTLTPEEAAEVNQVIGQAQNAIRQLETVSGRGQSLGSAAGVTLGAAGVLAADDVTVVGGLNDVAIPFVLLAAGVLALGAWARSSSTRDIERTGQAAQQAVEEAIQTIGQILMAQQVGNQVRGLTAQVVIHLARILGTTVGGQPPDHQNDPDRDRPHWWNEIKTFIRQIRDKGLSPRQLLRELRKQFNEAQLSEIREALRQAARRMGEDPPDFPPTAMP
ncbi:MAG TPA: hypothetical protein VGE45_12825 [Chloroflexia bacterium]